MAFHPPTHSQVPKKDFRLAQPVALLVPFRPIPGSHRDPPLFPLPPNHSPPTSGTPPLETELSLVAGCPLTLPFAHIGDARNAHFWVSSANTPTSLNTLMPSQAHPLPTASASSSSTPHPPNTQWPSLLRTLHPRLPSRSRPKTAAGSESSKEELVSQPLSWPILPSPGSSRGPPARPGTGGNSTRVRSAWRPQAWNRG